MVIMSDFSRPNFTKTNCIKLSENFQRVGILFYFYDDNKKLNFLFGIDYKHWELTDLGGMRSNGEDFMDTALREVYEESMCTIDMRDKKIDIYNTSMIVHNNEIAILFQPIEIDDLCLLIKSHRKNFVEGLKKNCEKRFLENVFLTWIDGESLLKLIQNNKNLIELPTFMSNVIKGENLPRDKYYPKIYDRISNFLEPIMPEICKLLNKS